MALTAELPNTRTLTLQTNGGVVQPVVGVGPQGAPGPGSAAWTALEAVTAATVRQAPDGSSIRSTTSRTTRATFDATEQGFWAPVLATAGTLENTALLASMGPGGTAGNIGTTQGDARYPLLSMIPTDLASVSADGPLTIGKATRVDASAAARTMTLADGATKGQIATVEKFDSGANTVTVTGKIRSASAGSFSLAYQYETIMFVWMGTYWEPLAGHRTKASIDTQLTASLGGSAATAVAAAIYTTATSVNLYNPADADNQVGYSLSLSGGRPTVVSAAYTTSGYIPVTAGLQYAISNPRLGAFYNSSKVYVTSSDINNASNATVIVTAPAGAAYLRVSFVTASYNATFQVEQGSATTAYHAYGSTYRIVDPVFAAAVGAAIPTSVLGAMSLTKAGNSLTVVTPLSDGATITETMGLTSSSNGAFGLISAQRNATVIHATTDDVTPLRTQFGAIGADHGYACVATFTNPDAKDTTDLGSVYHDTGGREYVLLAISGGLLVYGGDYTTDGSGVVSSANVAPTTNLTWVSGGTHHAAVVYTTQAASQLYPSIARIVTTVWVDEKQITADGTYTGNAITVRESYAILDYASLYDTAKANVGTSYTALTTVATAIRVNNVFRWTPSGCRISMSATELKPTTLGQCGAVQAVIPSAAGMTVTRYVPGVNTISGFNWTAGVLMTSYASNILVTTSDLAVAGRPPVLSLDVLDNGAPVVGFVVGYLPFGVRGTENSTNAQRIAHAPTILWDLRSTKKQYPTFTTAQATGWGTVSAEAFRAYITPAEITQVLAAKSDALAAWGALDAARQLSAA